MSSAVDVYNARLAVSKGKDVNQDSWMVMWCNTNWGDLLQPAPLSISLLGSLLVIASGSTDFSLIDVTKEFKSIQLKYVKFPSSFKACLQQMVGEGYTAFESASHNMTRIRNASSQLPDKIKSAAAIILQNPSPEEVEALLPLELEAISDLTGICVNAAKNAEVSFRGISDLAQEILECATFRVGDAEQRVKQNQAHIDALNIEKKQQEEIVKNAKEASDQAKKSFTEAEGLFKDAVKNVPSGWELMAMNLVESLTNTLTGGLNMMLGMGNTKGQYLQSGQNGGRAANSTLPSSPALSDPGLQLAQQVLTLIGGLDLLISGGPNGKPDWTNIRGEGGKSGGLFVEKSLVVVRDRLDKKKPVSQELHPLVVQAIEIAKDVNAKANSPDGANDTALDDQKPKLKTIKESCEGIVTRCNLRLQQTGNAAAGSGIPGTPEMPQNIDQNSSLATKAVDNAKHMVDQTRANLEGARKSYDTASERLIESQREITKTIVELTQLDLANAQLKEIIPVLVKAVKAFTTLRAQFSQLMEFFSAVASLVNDVMKPQVTSWASKVDKASSLVLGGVKLSDFYRNAIYTQMMGPLKVSMLAEKIASTYLKVSEKHIMPAQRQVGQLLQFQEDTSPEGRAKFLAELAKSQKTIGDTCKTASEGILDIVGEDQRKFSDQIKSRLESIMKAVAPALPSIKEPVPPRIEEVIDNHTKEVKEQKKEEKEAKPPYQPNIDDLI